MITENVLLILTHAHATFSRFAAAVLLTLIEQP